MDKVKEVNIWLRSDDFRFYCPFTGHDLFSNDFEVMEKIFADKIVVKELLYSGIPCEGVEWVSPKHREAHSKYIDEITTRSDDSILSNGLSDTLLFLSNLEDVEELLLFHVNDDVPAPACMGPWVLIYQTGC